MPEMGDAEQRRQPRVARSFMVRYRASSAGQVSWFVSPLRDLSSGGARFICETEFPLGLELEMQLLLPSAEAPVPIKARVAWAKPAPMKLTEHGVTFDAGDVGIQRTIDAAVAHFLRKQQGG